MPIAISDEHEEQRTSARRWLAAHCPPSVPRALLDAETEELQPVWKEMAAQGWLGIHLPEEFGGQGFGLFELAVLLEETGRSWCPGRCCPPWPRRRWWPRRRLPPRPSPSCPG